MPSRKRRREERTAHEIGQTLELEGRRSIWRFGTPAAAAERIGGGGGEREKGVKKKEEEKDRSRKKRRKSPEEGTY
ncbi:unnamed protein product [Sphagnum balticum]